MQTLAKQEIQDREEEEHRYCSVSVSVKIRVVTQLYTSA
jgi:hypothetical protein